MRTPAAIADETAEILRTLIHGQAARPGKPQSPGIRRANPEDVTRVPGDSTASAADIVGEQEAIVGTVVDVVSEAGVRQKALVLDFVPLEHAEVTVDGGTVVAQFFYGDSYPARLFGRVGDFTRVVPVPCMVRREVWMSNCVEILLQRLGDEVMDVDFEFDWVCGPLEALDAAE